MKGTGAARLVGWKRIAAHLGVSERSARRWEESDALPVHRQHHDARSTVFAYPDELDTWLESRAPDRHDVTPRSALMANRGIMIGTLFLLVLVMALGVVLTRPRTPPPLSADKEAVDLYERGSALYAERGREPVARAIKLFTRAVERDDDFAEAWAGLARAWAVYPTYDPAVSDERANAEAISAANRALTLKPELGDIRTLLVSAAYRKRDWSEAERLYREALEVDPDNPELLIWFVGHYRNAGMFEQVNALTEQAERLAPQSPPVLSEKAMNTMHFQDIERSEAQLDYIWSDLGLHTPIVWFGKFAAMAKRRDGAAMQAFLAELPFDNEEVFRRFAIAVANDTPTSRERFTTAVREDTRLPPWLAYYMLQDVGLIDQALTVAERAVRKGNFGETVVLFQPDRKEARRGQRFAAVAEGVGLIAYWQARGLPSFCKEERETPVCRMASSRN